MNCHFVLIMNWVLFKTTADFLNYLFAHKKQFFSGKENQKTLFSKMKKINMNTFFVFFLKMMESNHKLL